MLILAMETSTSVGSIALVRAPVGGKDGKDLEMEGKCLAEHTLNIPGTHSERLMPALDNLLQEASLSIREIGGIALALGPGSFTALRIGVSTVKGLAYALRVPVAGVPTLDVLAQNLCYASALVCPVLDARKKEVYAALYRGDGEGRLEKITEDWVIDPEELCSRIDGKVIFLGNGVDVYGETFREKLGLRALFAPPTFSLPRAVQVARLSIPRFNSGHTLNLFSFTPFYLRRSEAEIHFQAPPPSPSQE
jgi:tRNA threonylcarbamoyl adenosine modification protein YeaZ